MRERGGKLKVRNNKASKLRTQSTSSVHSARHPVQT